jgi:hypothetical protein
MTYRRYDPTLRLPEHWTPEQALAVFECLHARVRQFAAVFRVFWAAWPYQSTG